jgi:hypothetical protein
MGTSTIRVHAANPSEPNGGKAPALPPDQGVITGLEIFSDSSEQHTVSICDLCIFSLQIHTVAVMDDFMIDLAAKP